MAQRLSSIRIRNEHEYRAARDDLADLRGTGAMPDDPRVDELLEAIESYEASTRFVPDWSGESYRNAA